ncbi:polysaccharide deacetylase family protein [Thalassoglobus sp. JC818]|uniref:polysaccharide deacetylase family protein n=1 Tax=Thalassoglobus sp. JC818 TaxID=3232136 RepID=UPI0034589231
MNSSRISIVNFHGVGQPSGDIPRDELPYWISVTKFNDIIDLAIKEIALGNKIEFTVDDGNSSDIEIIAPKLAENGLSATFFILTGRLTMSGYLDADAIKKLLDSGMSIGLHGKEHCDWRAVNDTQFYSETIEARHQLEEICQSPIDTVSIPFGAYNKAVIRRLKATGFQKIFTSDGGTSTHYSQICPRTSIRNDMSDGQITDILTGRMSIKRFVKRNVSMFLRRHVV